MILNIGEYLKSRFTTLKPPLIAPENPIKLLRMLNCRHITFFFIGFLAWTFDAFDFFCVSLNITAISHTFNKSTADITWSIAITLMLRSVGAVIFGITGDRYGRKWPFIINIILYAAAGIASGFSRTFSQFIAFRAIFGIAMGGIYGNCAATALEDAPIVTRGLLSGLLQQGYSFGFLLAAIFNFIITDHQKYGWRAVFWFGGCPPLLIALWRAFLPETDAFLRVKQAREEADRLDHPNEVKPSSMHVFLHTVRPALRDHWLMLIYLVLMMTGFNFLSHGSQDLYPTFLETSLEFSSTLVTIATAVASCGALIGGITCGYFSSFFGRRLLVLITLVLGATLVPAYTLPDNKAIIIGAFFQQMCVQGVWGVVPIHLMELSPVQIRSFVVGVSYQLGNLISSVSSTIEAKAGEHFRTKSSGIKLQHGEHYDYSKVIAIFLLCVYAYLFIIIFIGPEKRNIDETITETKVEPEKVEA